MRPWFTVGALALAGRRANVVGAVRITLMPLDAGGLEIELVHVAGFSLGFAPGGVAEPVSFHVPYTAVRGLVREGRVLYLTFDPAVVTPFNRFALAGFTEELGPRRAGLRELWAWRIWDGSRSFRLRDLFEAELAERLALVPTPVEHGPARAPAVALRLPAHLREQAAPTPTLTRLRPAESSSRRESRGRLAWPLVAAAGAAVGIVVVMAFLQRYAAPREPPLVVDRVSSGLGAAARRVHPEAREPPEPARCVCTRADSPLWKDGLPVLGVLTFHGGDEAASAGAALVPSLDHAGFPQYDFDLAVVNDGARPLHDVRLTLTFARRDAAGRRVGAVDRGLFWGGVLAPGAAVKWRVSAPGSELRIDASVTGTLEQARLDAAPADAFFRLTASHFRAVRAHGALMLAYLRDPRALEAVGAAARALEAQSDADDPLFARIRRAAAPVFACDVRRSAGHVEACVFNGSSQPRTGLSLREVTFASGPSPRTFPVDVPVPVHEGRRIAVMVPDDLGNELAVVDPSVPPWSP